MVQILKLIESSGVHSGLQRERNARDTFDRGLSLRRYLERVQHTDPILAVTEILPFRLSEWEGNDEAA